MRWLLLPFLLAVALVASGASAVTVGYTCIRADSFSEAECQTGEDQFSSETTDAGSSLVSITFENSGPLASIIADVYVDDGLGLFAELDSIVDGTGVSFSEGAAPGNLPGGNNVGFTASFSADADSPVGTGGNGADPGEQLTLLLELANGMTFGDVLEAIESGDLRLGIHGQGLYPTGGSEAFVNGNSSNPVPEPTAALLFGLGVVVVHGRMRR